MAQLFSNNWRYSYDTNDIIFWLDCGFQACFDVVHHVKGELPWLLGFHFVVTTMLPLFAGSPNAVPTIDGSGDCSPCRRFMMG